jgi:hypothetical protein
LKKRWVSRTLFFPVLAANTMNIFTWSINQNLLAIAGQWFGSWEFV